MPPAAKSHFYLAEDFRSEQNGLVTAIGLYPEETVVLLESPGTTDETPKQHLVERLAFMVTVRCEPGTYPLVVSLSEPGKSTEQFRELVKEEITFSETNVVVNFVFKFIPYKVESLGEHALVVKVGDFYVCSHPFSFTSRPMHPQQALQSPSKP